MTRVRDTVVNYVTNEQLTTDRGAVPIDTTARVNGRGKGLKHAANADAELTGAVLVAHILSDCVLLVIHFTIARRCQLRRHNQIFEKTNRSSLTVTWVSLLSLDAFAMSS